MFKVWDEQHPGRMESMFSALCNVEPSHLADPQLFNLSENSRYSIAPSTAESKRQIQSVERH